jgi:5-methyltetrahydrofolate--homocysteine methyltransferase
MAISLYWSPVMKTPAFLIVGENIHCTRIFKVGGKNVGPSRDGRPVITYAVGRESRELPVPDVFLQGADWAAGKVKHCAVALWQGLYGDPAGKAAGVDYLQALARRQEALGAAYLDINVDEFSTDVDEKIRAMTWICRIVQDAVRIPLSIDSSNLEILRTGLDACDRSRGRPMVNSVSLERRDAIALAARAGAVVIASAAGEQGMPGDTAERLSNIRRLMPLLEEAGFDRPSISLDPLVFPISVDSTNGIKFLEAVRALRAEYGPAIHIVAGLSNVSFGLPNRKLINQVFSWLAVEAGADGGIVDPVQINKAILEALDPNDRNFKLAADLLLGRDEYGLAYIEAFRGAEGG